MQRFVNCAEKISMPGYPPWLASLLYARGADTPEKARAFLNPGPEMLNDPHLLSGMEDSCALLRNAAASRARVAIYGDYDTDGICASAILAEALCRIGVEAFAYIPERESEGYGLNTGAVRLLSERAGILVTVDCGITGVAEVALAKSLGMRVIVTDHHTLPEKLPEADAVISPLLSGYPFPYLCGAGIAWKTACALLGFDIAREYLDLAALATIADMVPLTGENRTIAFLGLRQLSSSARPGIVALKRSAGIEGNVTAENVSFMLAPRLNAGGRLASAMDAYELITTRDHGRAAELAAVLNELNARRRQEEKEVLLAAEKQIAGMDLYRDRVIVVSGQGWNAGVVGLAAGKLAERYGYPAVAFSVSEDAYVGSARSAGGIDIYSALKECGNLFLRFGGHRQAAGMMLKPGCLIEFSERLNAAVRCQLDGRELMPEFRYDGSLELQDVNEETAALLGRLEPYGIGNPVPHFLLSGASALSARGVGTGGEHLKLTLSKNGVVRDAIAFGMGGNAGILSGCIDTLFQPVLNVFRGKTSAECRLKAIRPCGEPFVQDKDAEIMDILQELTAENANEGECAETLEDVPDAIMTGAQGTLLLCRTAETGNLMKKRFPHADAAVGICGDARAYHTVCLRPIAATASAPYRDVILCDGQIAPAEAARLARLYPMARIRRLPLSAPLLRRLQELRLDRDYLRECYRSMREGRLTALPREDPRAMCAVYALKQLSLAEISGERITLLPMRACDPGESTLYRFLSLSVPV